MTKEEHDEILRKRYSILTYDEVTNFAINMRTLLFCEQKTPML